MDTELKNTINELYNPQLSIIEIIIPFIIIFIVLCITLTFMIQIELTASSLNWEKNKCIPKYMFLSGFIKKDDKLGILASTEKNFKECVKQYITPSIPYKEPPINNRIYI
jgi:hypothetical protein